MIIDTKPILKSKTIWGILIALLPTLDTALSLVGVLPPGTLSEGSKVILGAAGSLLALYGRIKATKKIG